MKTVVPEPATTRDRIVDAADALFYRHGFERTSFADIAAEVGLSRGNFYYHFKTKDEILCAVIALRATRTTALLEAWTNGATTPLARLCCFAQMLVQNREAIQRQGCPVGTLCTELAKLDHPAQGEAGMLFVQFREWLREQFEQLGHPGNADALALHLLARSQGIATLAQTFQEEAFIRREVEAIETWLRSLQPPSRPAAARHRVRRIAPSP